MASREGSLVSGIPLFLKRFVVCFCLKYNKMLSFQIKYIANCDILVIYCDILWYTIWISGNIILKKLLFIVLVICGALAFAWRRRCSSEPTSTSSPPRSHGFHNLAYQLEPVYQEVGDSITETNYTNINELCYSVKNIKTEDEVVDILNDKPSWKDDHHLCFGNKKAEPNQCEIK